FVLGVGEGITPFNIVDAQFVEPLGDPQLVLEREVDPLALASVAQGRVVDRDPSHGRCYLAARSRATSPIARSSRQSSYTYHKKLTSLATPRHDFVGRVRPRTSPVPGTIV